MVTEVFGEMLFHPEPQHFEQFPSPEELKYHVILSTKPPKEYLEQKMKTSKEKGNTSPTDSSECDMSSIYESDSDQDNDDGDAAESKSGQQGPPEYKHLIAIRAGKPKNGLREALKVSSDKVRRLSLSEQLLERAASNYGHDVVR